MSIIKFPFLRLTYPGVGNPDFVDDILVANQLTLDGLTALTNLPNPGFAIISGFNYDPANQVYGSGVFWLNGSFYYTDFNTPVGAYLQGNLVPTLDELFEDDVTRPIYQIQYSQIQSQISDQTSPVFTNNMDINRIGLYDMKGQILNINAKLTTLGTAAFLNVGTIPGTVAAGDDSRFGYSKAQADNLFATKVSVLLRGNPGGNNTGFIPTDNFDPATKQYVDSIAANRKASGAGVAVGNPGQSGTVLNNVTSIYQINFPADIGTSSYGVAGDLISVSGNTPGLLNDVNCNFITTNHQSTGFQLVVKKKDSGVGACNLSFNYVLFGI